MAPSFAPHGGYHAEIAEPGILVCTTRGTWNMEMHHEMTRQARPFVEALEAQGPWGTVVVMAETLVSNLDVLEAGRNAVAEARGLSRMRSLAWVIAPTVEGYRLLLPRYRDMYRGIIDTAVFEALEPALAWTREGLARPVQAPAGV